MKYKKTILILITVLLLAGCVFIIENDFSVSARRGAGQVDRTKYMSDVLRITDGVMPVLWIDPQYSYESSAKYFDLSGNGNHGTQSDLDKQPTVKPQDYILTAQMIMLIAEMVRV